MWDRLKQADIAQARQQLDLRRDEILKKHAEEIESLAAVQVEIETLDDLASAFSRKFRQSHTSPDVKAAPTAPVARPTTNVPPITVKPATTVKPAPTVNPAIAVKPASAIKPNDNRVAHRHSLDKPAPKVRHLDRRGHRTNFEVFSHAMTKNERGW